MKRIGAGLGLLLVAGSILADPVDWGADRLLVAGQLGQYGVSADRTPGPDTLFVGVIKSAPEGDTLQLYRSIDRANNWDLIWWAVFPDERLSNLVLRVGSGIRNWVFLCWLADNGSNNCDIRGARVTYDGLAVEYFFPTPPGAPDTIRWLAFTRSFGAEYRLYLFWQDEQGLTGEARNPITKFSISADYGTSWTAPRELLAGFETPAVDYGAPGCIYLAARSITVPNIGLLYTSSDGDTWQFTAITRDSLPRNNMFPSVAATHDSAVDARVWVSYDNYRSGNWSVRGAYSTNGGSTWVFDQLISSSAGHQFLSALDCAGYGSRRIQIAYLVREATGYTIYYRTGNLPRPSTWTAAIRLSDFAAYNAMPPVVTNYGTPDDSLNRGVVFYAEPGPTNLWYDAYQFAGTQEEPQSFASNPLCLRVDRVTSAGLRIAFRLSQPMFSYLTIADAAGRLIWQEVLGTVGAGDHIREVPVRTLRTGTYFVILKAESGRPRYHRLRSRAKIHYFAD